MPLENHDLRTTQSPAEVPPPGAVETALAGIQALPENTLILIPTRNLVLFPGTVLPITLGRQRTIAAAQAAGPPRGSASSSGHGFRGAWEDPCRWLRERAALARQTLCSSSFRQPLARCRPEISNRAGGNSIRRSKWP